MNLSIGIVGLPNVGKSTLFKTLTKKEVDIANYPFCTIEPNIGTVLVPDERVDKLAQLSKYERKIYATIKFVDIAGLVKGASQGEGLGNKFLSHIREVDAVLYVLRAFKNPNIVNTQNQVNPLKEKEILDIELIMKDLETLEKRIDNLQGPAKTGRKEAIKEIEILKKAEKFLKESKLLCDKEMDDDEKNILKNLCLLTTKPRLYLLNGKREEIGSKTLQTFQKNNWKYVIVDVQTEFEVEGASSEERKELGLEELSEMDILIKNSYELLDLITFLTTGEKETRAWTIKKSTKAPQAGGVIHSDFEKNFIKAEVIFWKDLIDSGSYAKAREQGKIHTEGKDYIVRDGDVIEFKHG